MPKAKPKRPNSNPTASAKIDPKVEQILATLRAHREMGRDIAVRKLKIKAFAVEKGIPERALRTRRAFFLAYKSENEFQRFCKLRFKGSNRPLNSSYIRYLLTIKDKVKGLGKSPADARYAFAEQAAKNDLSPAQLHDLIKRQCGRQKSLPGRTYRPRDKATAIEDVAREAVKWIKRCEAAIEFKSTAKPTKTLEPLLLEFSKWTVDAVTLCKAPIDAESVADRMRTSLKKIQEMLSSCVVTMTDKTVKRQKKAV